MNTKRIIQSSLMLVALAAVTAAGTGAFFSDTETSTGNVFTAGAIDLKIDHSRQIYNGVDCQTCSVSVYSSTDTLVVDSNDAAVYQGSFPVNAQLITNPNPAWLNENTVTPAEWIWITPIVDGGDTTNDAEYVFEDSFMLQGPIAVTDFNLSLASDNGYKLVLNGTTIVDALNTEFTYNAQNPLTVPQQAAFQAALIQNGLNTLQITVRNKADNPNPNRNPAGLIYKIDFTNEDCEAGVADYQQMCQLWAEKDLETETFFDFSDVKPQDNGSNLISLHVDSNDAYLCLAVANQDDAENTNISPEIDAGDVSVPEGELGEFLMVAAYYSDEFGTKLNQFLAPTPVEDVDSFAFADSTTTQPPVLGNTTEYMLLEWCLGTLENDGSCDGDVVNINQTQTDSFIADLQFSAIQTRNNENYTCVEELPIDVD